MYTFPTIHDELLFGVSLFLLLLGHLVYLWIWSLMINKEHKIDKQYLFESESITIFNKYIPGKIWVVVGPVGYLKKFYDITIFKISQLSLHMQVMIIWTGLFVGIFFLHLLKKELILLYSLLFIILTLYLFSNAIHAVVEKTILFTTHKKITFVKIDFEQNIKILVLSVVLWLIWSLAFYLMVIATSTDINIHFSVAFVFPIASVIGILALLSPGGLGIREGVMVFLLVSIGLSSKNSIQISVDSRIWFLFFECLVFVLSVISILCRKIKNKKEFK